jgi:hypothetical protein
MTEPTIEFLVNTPDEITVVGEIARSWLDGHQENGDISDSDYETILAKIVSLEIKHSNCIEQPDQHEDQEPEIDDSAKFCPECETPNQFGELCNRCREAIQVEIEQQK